MQGERQQLARPANAIQTGSWRRGLAPDAALLDILRARGLFRRAFFWRSRMSIAFVFPGQGSQAVGMGKALADQFGAAKKVFEEVDAALKDKLTTVMWEGPAEALTLTENAQPALLAVSLAAMRVIESEAGVNLGRDAAFVAGHSLGEYSALAAAGALALAGAAGRVGP